LLIREENLGLLESLVLKVLKSWFWHNVPIAMQTQEISQYHATNMCYMNAQNKEEVIPSILAKGSLNLELRLRRYGEKNLRDLFVISKKWLGLIWNYFSNSGGRHENWWTAG
jgi:hypothetical protein